MPVRVLLLAFCVTFLAVALRDGHGTENPTTVPKRERIVDAKSLVISAHRNGTIHLENAIIRGPLNLSYLTIDQQVLLVNCEFEDRADFSYATFKRDLDLHNSTFNKGFNFRAATVELNGIFNDLKVLFEPSEHKSMEEPLQEADLRYFHVKGVFQMRDAVDSASTYFAHAQFDKDVDLRGSVFGENAVLTEMQVGGDLFAEKVHFKKQAHFGTTKIAGSLFLAESQFDELVSFAGMQTAHDAKLPKTTFKNHAYFNEIEVDSFLDLSGAKFEWAEKQVDFHLTHVLGMGFFDSVQFAGGARFDNAHFNSDANFENSVFDGDTYFDKAHFDQAAHFETSVFKKKASVAYASAGTIVDDEKSWPTRGNLILNGFIYEQIDAKSPQDVETRLKWLNLQPETLFMPQPYLQLAKVLREAGDDDGARRVLIAMEDRRWETKDRQLPPFALKLWIDSLERWPLRVTVGYGYRPLWAFFEVVGLSALGWIIYRRSYLGGNIVPTDKDAYESFKLDGQPPAHYGTFAPLIYSVENSLPLVKLGQADKWQPNPNPASPPLRHRIWVIKPPGRQRTWPRSLNWLHRFLILVGLQVDPSLERPSSRFNRWGTTPKFLRWFLWIQILLGWLLATLFVAGVTGIVRTQ